MMTRKLIKADKADVYNKLGFSHIRLKTSTFSTVIIDIK